MEDKDNELSEGEKKELIQKYKNMYGPDYTLPMTILIILQMIFLIFAILKK